MMTGSRFKDSDALLWRAHRIVARGRSMAAVSGDVRPVMFMIKELCALIGQLKARATQLSIDRETAARRQSAITAYRRCLNLRRR